MGVNFKEYKYCSKWRCGNCDKTERDKDTWLKVRKGTILTTKSNPYYIELSNAYSLLDEFSYNPSQADQTMNIESQFKISAAIGYHEKKRNKINKYIIVNKDNDAVLINAAITIAEDERNVMDKYNMTGGR